MRGLRHGERRYGVKKRDTEKVWGGGIEIDRPACRGTELSAMIDLAG